MTRGNSIRLKHTMGIISVLFFMIPSWASIAKAQESTAWQAPADAKKVVNPVKSTPDGLKEAGQSFQTYCMPCHGKSGAGDGPAAATLNPKPANFTDSKLMSEATDGELFWKISTGRGPMPSWKDLLSETQRWQMVNYLRTLSKKSEDSK